MRELYEGSFASNFLNSLTTSIAILNSRGKIVAVNDPWKNFTKQNNGRDADAYLGWNYLSVCKNALKISHDESIARVIEGIEAVLSEQASCFEHEYPCHSPTEERWFCAQITRFMHKDKPYVVISHRNITEQKTAEQALVESQELYHLLFENSMDAIMLTAPDGRIFSANPASQKMLGRTEAEIQSLGRGGVIDIEDPKVIGALHEREQTGKYHGEITGVRKDGSKFPIEITSSIFTNRRGELLTSTIFRDISERRKVEEQIRYHSLLLENVNDVIIGTDPEFFITYWNKAAEHTFGWKSEEVMGQSVTELLKTEFTDDDYENSVRSIRRDGTWRGEVIQYTRNGRAVPVDANIIALQNNAGAITGYVSANRDITKRKQAEEELNALYRSIQKKNKELRMAFEREQYMARIDIQTGVYNHRHFQNMAAYEYANATRYEHPLSVLIFDIDRFKQVNDTHGHPFGDKMLAHIAQLANQRIRESDILARYGGEEFVILLPNTEADQAFVLAEDMRTSIEKAGLENSNKMVQVTISVGIAQLLPENDSIEELVQRADKALYQAKESGRNRTMIFS